MRLTVERVGAETVLTFRVSDHDLMVAPLDHLDRVMIDSPKEGAHWISDTLLDAQVVAHRLEQLYEVKPHA